MEISIHYIIKKFGDKTVVSIPEFVIHSGELLGLVGNNGAGKTTLFRLMLDLLKADKGDITFLTNDKKENPAESEDWKSYTGAYIDEKFLIDFLTPEEYFEFIAKANQIDQDTLAKTLSSFNNFLGDEVIGQKKLIRDFSAGNKQKIGIVGALLNQPRLLILDEPFNFLDPSSQNQLKKLLIEYNKETGATILVSSHNLQHTIDISSRIVLMEKGSLIKDLKNDDNTAKQELENYFEKSAS